MKALFDFDFRKFVTPSIIKIVYILIMVLLAVSYLAIVIGSFRANVGLGFLVLIVLGPLFCLIYLVLARAGLESLIAQIRTAENTAELVRLAGGTPPSDQGSFQINPVTPAGPTNPAQQPQPSTDPNAGNGRPGPENPYKQ
ncbi:DUF4282 domain-containing protein [Glutamicibacter sp. NPDC087344]|uniref:DUF4282 domain-containing protein n=1 Tax=Glutamicibacter sp. NPDC087344 TaxID=3363994 RepID=UPI0037F87727